MENGEAETHPAGSTVHRLGKQEVHESTRKKAGLKLHPKLPLLLYMVFSLVMITSGLWWGHYLQYQFYVVEADEQEIGLVTGQEEVKEILQRVKENQEEEYGMEVALQEELNFTEEFRPYEKEDLEAVERGIENLTFQTMAYKVVVDGEPLFKIKNENKFDNILENLKQEYASREREAQVKIKEEIELEKTAALPEEVLTAEAAYREVLGGRDRKEVHQISRGETLEYISRHYQVSGDRIKQTNPEISETSLQIGEEVDVVYEEPLLTVETYEKVTEKESISYPVEEVPDSDLLVYQREVEQPGEPGIKEITYRVKRENGRKVEREKVSEEVVEEPQKQVKSRGTATYPTRDTGPFKWPVEGGGRITQPFGGAHRGVDIADNRGTPILAAHQGTVSSVREFAGTAGHSITIRHHLGNATYYTVYMHNEQNLVSEGEEVSQGQLIARMGDTGRATGVHLHFEIRKGVDNRNASVDPLNYFAP